MMEPIKNAYIEKDERVHLQLLANVTLVNLSW